MYGESHYGAGAYGAERATNIGQLMMCGKCGRLEVQDKYSPKCHGTRKQVGRGGVKRL